MTNFDYIAVDRDGREVRGRVDAADWQAAREQLSSRGLTDCRPDAPLIDTPLGQLSG